VNGNIASVYRNARFNGVTGVGSAQFGRHTGQFMGVHANQLGQTGMVRGALPLNPDRSSMHFTNRSVNPGRFPQTNNSRFRAGNSSTGSFSQRGNANVSTGDHGWRRFGEPIHNGQSSGSGANAQGGRGFGSSAPAGRFSSDGGWRRFGGGSQPSNNNGGGWSRPQSAAPRNAAPASSGYRGNSGAGQSVRISPPIVRNGGGNNGAYRAPQNYGGNNGGGYRAPQGGGGYRAPQGNGGYSAPRGNSGGGGGGSRPSGGGGGGSHASSGGGGGHSSSQGGHRR
jgi:hypothetical protein